MIDLIVSLLFVFTAVSAGAFIYRAYRMPFYSPLQFMLFSYALGLGIISFLLFLFGAAGILYAQTIHLFLIVLLVCSAWSFYRNAKNFMAVGLLPRFFRQPFIGYCLLAIIGVYIGLTFIAALAPPTNGDSLVYHLAIPKRFLKYHCLLHTQAQGVDLSDIFIMPFGFELLYVIPLALRQDIAGQLLQWGTAVCGAAALYALMARFFSRTGGLFAAAVFLTQPAFVRFIATPKPDTAVVLYVILGLYAFFEWYENRQKKWLLCCGIQAGLYLACRLTGLFTVMIFTALIFCKLFYSDRAGLQKALRRVLYFLIPALLIPAPWLVRSWLLTGDPFYPYLNRLFGSYFATYLFHPKDMQGLLLYFWNLTFVPATFLFERSISPFYIAFLPGLFVLRHIDRKIVYTLVFGLVSVYALFPLQVQTRYLFAGLAALSIVAGYVISSLFLRINNAWFRNLLAVLLCLSFVAEIRILYYETLPVVKAVIRRQRREDYLRRELGDYYKMAEYINNGLSPGSVVFDPWENRSYYMDKVFLSGCWSVEKMLNIKSAGEWADLLRERYNVDYVLLSRRYHESLIELYETKCLAYDPRKNLIYSEDMQRYLEPVYSIEKCTLYKLRSNQTNENRAY